MTTATGSEIQVDGGNFTRIHNAILERLAKSPDLNGAAFRCLMFLFRQTYGFGKKQDTLSFSQWVDGTGIEKRQIIRTIKKLVDAGYINAVDNGNNRAKTYGFNKYFWDNQTSDNPTTKTSDNSTTHKRKKESSSSETELKTNPTAAAFSKNGTPEPPDLYGQFRLEFERVWGLLVASRYMQERIEDWTQRVPLKAWTYALTECAGHSRVGQWKYLETILKRLERDGLSDAPATAMQPAAQVDISLAGLL